MRPFRFALAGIAAAVEAAVAVAFIFTSDHNAHPWLIAAFAVTAGLSFIVAGLVALWRRPENSTGFLLAATGYLWFLAGLTDSNDSWIWTIGFISANLALISFGALILSYPEGTLIRRDRWLIAVGGAAAVLTNTITALVDETPAIGCPECPPSSITIAESPGVRDVVTVIGTVVVGGVLVAIAVILAGRWRQASIAQRRTLRPVFLSCLAAVTLLLVSVLAERLGDRAHSVVWILFLTSFAAVPLTFLAGVLRSRFDRAAAARILLSLDAGVPLRDALAQALHDPSLEIVYRLDDGTGWVDADGGRVDEPVATAERSITTIERGGRTVAALAHDPALDAEPEVVAFIASGAGLPLENVRLQAELRAQYLMLETIANTAPSLLVVIDTDGRVINQNRATLDAAGVDDEELVRGRYFWEVFIDPVERPAVVQRFLDAAPDHPAASYENTFTNNLGARLVIEWRSAPITDATGRVVSIVAGGIDITERKQREVQLQRERDITETLMQAIPSLIVVVDSDAVIVDSGVEETRAGVNNAFRSVLGWPDDELVRRSVLDLIDPGDGYLALMTIAAAANGVASPERESRWLRADGERVVVAWTATPVADVTGRKASLVLLSGVDVTERKQQEEEIRASRTRIIEAADEARRKLERNLHDGAQQRLVSLSVSLRLAESLLATDAESAASVIVGARAELAAALDELRELARGIHPAVLTDRGLAAAVEGLVLRAPIPVEVSMPNDRLPPPIEAAAYYVVAESLTNVVKYASATRVAVTVETGEEGVTVVVVDDGMGGADPTTGSGLRGLNDRVAALDGTLVVDSPVGEGTRVTAAIPLERGSEVSAMPAVDSRP